ncbi:MAG: DUF6088 family protein [Candidatus Pseudobacter hemicellulosilyticus]|uniref:DUF6088 family protein n=1 Tax=Candidatus Pseudobacter hemicellulosilyticus TaxID=3121375 RepID=A0AAJ5WSN3_9BACT|nr:MAG: DUF6088 family protein [Pseudobacter sp.]
MKVTDAIAKKVENLEAGQVFSFSDVAIQPEKMEAVVKALNRMVSTGKLSKLGKGKFYKAKQTVFGNLEPDQYQVVKDLLETDGKIIGYLTGYSIYNKLGLTTQVSNIIQIGRNDIRAAFKRGRYTISFIKQKNEITIDNIFLLQVLDAIRYIKKIPDTYFLSSLERLIAILNDLPGADKKKLVTLSLKYPAATRALVGAMLEETGHKELTKKIKETLNPLTIYKMPSAAKLMKHTEKWNIK